MCAENIKMKSRKLAIVTISVLLLAGTVAISVTVSEDAFAKTGRYTGDTSQAAAVSNECLDPIFDSNEDIDNAVGVGNCAGTVSQQDESGSTSAPITSQTANPDIELQRTTGTQTPGLGSGETDPITTCFAQNAPLTNPPLDSYLDAFHTFGQSISNDATLTNLNGGTPITSNSALWDLLTSVTDTQQQTVMQLIVHYLGTSGFTTLQGASIAGCIALDLSN